MTAPGIPDGRERRVVEAESRAERLEDTWPAGVDAPERDRGAIEPAAREEGVDDRWYGAAQDLGQARREDEARAGVGESHPEQSRVLRPSVARRAQERRARCGAARSIRVDDRGSARVAEERIADEVGRRRVVGLHAERAGLDADHEGRTAAGDEHLGGKRERGDAGRTSEFGDRDAPYPGVEAQAVDQVGVERGQDVAGAGGRDDQADRARIEAGRSDRLPRGALSQIEGAALVERRALGGAAQAQDLVGRVGDAPGLDAGALDQATIGVGPRRRGAAER